MTIYVLTIYCMEDTSKRLNIKDLTNKPPTPKRTGGWGSLLGLLVSDAFLLLIIIKAFSSENPNVKWLKHLNCDDFANSHF